MFQTRAQFDAEYRSRLAVSNDSFDTFAAPFAYDTLWSMAFALNRLAEQNKWAVQNWKGTECEKGERDRERERERENEKEREGGGGERERMLL